MATTSKRERISRRLRIGPDFAVFLLFFGAALFEALRHGEWAVAAVFVALGVIFLRQGSGGKRRIP